MVLKQDVARYATKYGYHDLMRVGLFIEMPYMCSGQKRDKPRKTVIKLPEILGAMLPGGAKTKCGNQDGYFEETFKRVFIGEYRTKKKKKKKGVIKTAFLPAGPGKVQATPGDYYGCFIEDEWPERFDPSVRHKKKPMKVTKNLIVARPNPFTNPGKKGGPGFIDITINPYPEHSNEPPPKAKKKKKRKLAEPPPFYIGQGIEYFILNPYYDPWNDPPKKPIYIPPKAKKQKRGRKTRINPVFIPAGPGKWPGGSHNGCFGKWPKHMDEPYLSPAQLLKYVKPVKKKVKETKMLQKPAIRTPNLNGKTMQYRSVLNTEIYIHNNNWKTFTPIYVQYL